VRLPETPEVSHQFNAGTNSDYKEANWFLEPEGTFSLYIRCYWGKEAVLDGSWTPPVIEQVK
jgi:hypothetical protein